MSPTPEATPCAIAGASTDEKDGEAGEDVALLRDVRKNPDGCPRVTFEFQSEVPGYEINYDRRSFSECGSGKGVSPAGWGADAFLSVHLEPASGFDLSTGQGRQTYAGPRDIPIGGRVLKHMRQTCDFEAVMQWVIGLDTEHPFKVSVLDGPPRIVIDFSAA